MHPLLSPRLYSQAKPAPLPPLRTPPHQPVRSFLARTTKGLIARYGKAAGFLLGLALAWWFFAPHVVR